jgi:hypothetical protein
VDTAACSGIAAGAPLSKTGSNPRLVRDDYVPTGFKPYGAKTFAVKGHPFGLALSEDDRKALIAFLKTL